MVHVSSESSVCCFPIHARSSVPFCCILHWLVWSNSCLLHCPIYIKRWDFHCHDYKRLSQLWMFQIWAKKIFGETEFQDVPLFIHGLSMVYHGLSIVGAMDPPWFIAWSIMTELRRDTGGCNLKGCCPTFTVMAPLSPGDSKASVPGQSKSTAEEFLQNL